MLTKQQLIDMPPGKIFATGKIENGPDWLYMVPHNKWRLLHQVAVRWHGPDDRAIYTLRDSWYNDRRVAEIGDKVIFTDNIQKLVPCDDDALSTYRR